ncbi:16S rRNA (uracil(1498)-N(3))-methyltransferase [Caldalkalibacillus salinus]|uniref:16S rRNA (uracil(1498)-N(3))-methyltransferase n=1 Tax=Caldalkalibacillus salinus TaxID=2803787 RepID=UPI001921638C|nr:16S rRNA (uracil(1498)-N(3))-methyltransferase [Caldalkalibacillus salinus]
MQRYFISAHQMSENQCLLEGQDVHHIKNVMRADVGDQLICSNGKGRVVLCTISLMEERKVVCDIIEELDGHTELPVHVTVAQGLPKADKLEWILQKGTELGADRFIPFSSARTIVRYDQKKEKKKQERWAKIIKEASEQSHRALLPEVTSIHSFTALLNIDAEHKWVAYEKETIDHEGMASFAQAMSSVKRGERIIIAIGPEGGFTEEEIHTLHHQGYRSISLGPRILRTETASQYVLSSISYHFEQMGG